MGAMTEFAFEESRRGGVAELALSGDLDMTATFRLEPALDRLLEGEGVSELVLDLSGVAFVDSSGLGLLLATYQRSQEAERQMAIVNSRPEIQRVFRLAGVDDVLPISP
jgi:anti-sigma B factor antagonist